MCANRHESPKPKWPEAADAQNCYRTIQLTCVEATWLFPDFTARPERALLPERVVRVSQKMQNKATFPGKRGGGLGVSRNSQRSADAKVLFSWDQRVMRAGTGPDPLTRREAVRISRRPNHGVGRLLQSKKRRQSIL